MGYKRGCIPVGKWLVTLVSRSPFEVIPYIHIYICKNIYLGKLEYFTNLKLAAIEGDDFPEISHDSSEGGQ